MSELVRAHNVSSPGEEDGAGRGGPLVEGDDMIGHCERDGEGSGKRKGKREGGRRKEGIRVCGGDGTRCVSTERLRGRTRYLDIYTTQRNMGLPLRESLAEKR